MNSCVVSQLRFVWMRLVVLVMVSGRGGLFRLRWSRMSSAQAVRMARTGVRSSGVRVVVRRSRSATISRRMGAAGSMPRRCWVSFVSGVEPGSMK